MGRVGRWVPRFPWLAVIAAAAFAGLVPVEASSFVRSVVPRTETCLYWNVRTLIWSMNREGSRALGLEEARDVFRRSFETWDSVPCTDLAFAEDPPTESSATGYREGQKNFNLIVFRSVGCDETVPVDAACRVEGGCGNLFACWDFDRNVIAVTTTTFRERSGEILDADIELNEADFDFTTVDGPPCGASSSASCVSTDLQNTATHEIGHFLGLDHVDDPDATMFASARVGETAKRALSEDEERAVCEIYPAGEATWVCNTSSGRRPVGSSEGCSCGGSGAASLVGWILGLAVFARMRRAASRTADPSIESRGMEAIALRVASRLPRAPDAGRCCGRCRVDARRRLRVTMEHRSGGRRSRGDHAELGEVDGGVGRNLDGSRTRAGERAGRSVGSQEPGDLRLGRSAVHCR